METSFLLALLQSPLVSEWTVILNVCIFVSSSGIVNGCMSLMSENFCAWMICYSDIPNDV